MTWAPGAVVADRFEIVRPVARGGMGQVFEATDRARGVPVALKTMLRATELEGRRFAREAAALAELSHPAVVGYVDHGVSDGRLYLAMQWLEGEDLGARLRREPLTRRQTVDLARRLADALAALHGAGILHRDLKPSNVFLPDGDPARAMLLDLGIARLSQSLFGVSALTEDGQLVGTPAYLAPEQARAQAVDARTDLFSLGVILWECLTGRRAFVAPDVMGVLARVMFEALEPPRAFAPDLSPALDHLVVHMTRRDPSLRPASAEAVRDALDALSLDEPAPRRRTSILSPAERRIVAVVAGRPEDVSGASTVSSVEAERSASASLAAPYGAKLEVLADGSMFALIDEGDDPRERSRRAARLAQSIGHWVDRRVVTTGHVITGADRPAGDAIDRATRLLALTEPGRVRIDDATAAALRGAFEVIDTGGALLLGSPLAPADPTDPPSELIGRAREVGIGRAVWEGAIASGRPRGLVLTGPPGIGKSRLALELARRAGARCDVALARAGVVPAPYAALAPALRSALGVADDAPLERARAAIGADAEAVAGEDGPELATLLGELAGIPMPAAGTELMTRLRADPRALGGILAAAFVRWVDGRTRRRPLLFLLDDAHRADAASLAVLEAALRSATGPFAAIALGRPGPPPWRDGVLGAAVVGPLAAAESAALARRLDPALDSTAGRRIAQRSEGNPFFVEELVEARRRGDPLPQSLLATVQMRLDALSEPTRRVLRAASVLGERFWAGAIEALLGGGDDLDVPAELARLEREGIVEPATATIAGARALRFTHDLVREASYAMLTDEDARRGHRLAAEWLEAHARPDPAVLADHLDRAGQQEDAAPHHVAAAARALAADDLAGAIHHADRAQAAAGAEVAARAAVIGGEARIWAGAQGEARDAVRRALDALPTGSDAWLDAAGVFLDAAAAIGDDDGVTEVVDALVNVERADAGRHALTLARVHPPLCFLEHHVAAERVLRLAMARARGAGVDRPLRARIANARAVDAVLDGRLVDATEAFRESADHFEAVGALRWAASQRANLGSKLLELGRVDEATRVLRAALEVAATGGFPYVRALAKLCLGLALRLAGDPQAALTVQSEAAQAWALQIGDPRLESAARSALAEVLLDLGRPDDAWAEATDAVRLAAGTRAPRAAALAVLARVALATGDAAEALAHCEQAAALAAEEPMLDRAIYLAATHGDALVALGRVDEARALAERAWPLLERVTRALTDDAARRAFLEAVPEHRRVVELRRLRAD